MLTTIQSFLNMIIKKNEDGTYVCESNGSYYVIPSKEYYLNQLNDLISIPKPTQSELIKLGEQCHPYYQKQNSIDNINNQLSEIEEFNNGNNII